MFQKQFLDRRSGAVGCCTLTPRGKRHSSRAHTPHTPTCPRQSPAIPPPFPLFLSLSSSPSLPLPLSLSLSSSCFLWGKIYKKLKSMK